VSTHSPLRGPDPAGVTGARRLRIGTRSSALAVAQAGTVAQAIAATRPVELVRSSDRPTGDLEDKSRWVAGIEGALLRGELDLAVHSAKDLPVELPDGLALIGAPARADARDVLCGASSLAALAPGARVGTGSLRRMAQLHAARPDLEVCECRGNVDTRLRKLDRGEFAAIVLAAAGLDRLGLPAGAPLDELVPAAGQGTLALEARVGDEDALAAVAGLRDPRCEVELWTERAVVAALGAGCHTPLGVHATWRDGRLRLRAFVGLPDGSVWIRDELVGPVGIGADALRTADPDGFEVPAADPAALRTAGEALGRELAERLLSAGAGALLR
jgi:hydroxymethylbilane synthase